MLKNVAAISHGVKIYSWLNAGLIQLFLGGIALILVDYIEYNDWRTPAYLNLASGFFILVAIIRAFRHKGIQLLSDHLLVFAIMYSIYYVFGALLIEFGTKEEVERSLSYYKIDAQMAMRVAAVNCIGFGLALIAGATVERRLISRLTRSVIGIGSNTPKNLIIFVFFLVGGCASIYTSLADLDPNPEIISGVWRNLSQLVTIGIFIATAYRGQNSRFFLILAIIFTLLQVVAGVLLMNKSILLQNLAIFIVGLTWRFNSSKILIPGFAIIIAVYIIIGGPISQLRNVVGTLGQVNLSERVNLMNDVIRFGSETDQVEQYGYWTRFSYLVPQGAAIEFFDQDQGGNDYTLLGWTFLPRALFSEKPNMTASGQEFHYKITGSMTSSTGQGVFVNGYYNLGWVGVIFVGILVGAILAWTSALATVIIEARAFLWVPFALIGCYMAFRIDGNFVSDYLGPFVMLIYIVISALFLQRIIIRKPSLETKNNTFQTK